MGFLGNNFGWRSARIPSLFPKIQIVVLRLSKRDGRTHQQPPVGAGSSQHAKPGLHRVKKNKNHHAFNNSLDLNMFIQLSLRTD